MALGGQASRSPFAGPACNTCSGWASGGTDSRINREAFAVASQNRVPGGNQHLARLFQCIGGVCDGRIGSGEFLDRDRRRFTDQERQTESERFAGLEFDHEFRVAPRPCPLSRIGAPNPQDRLRYRVEAKNLSVESKRSGFGIILGRGLRCPAEGLRSHRRGRLAPHKRELSRSQPEVCWVDSPCLQGPASTKSAFWNLSPIACLCQKSGRQERADNRYAIDRVRWWL